MTFNLFNVTVGCNTLGEKPRAANMEERNAYLRWLAERDGIPVPVGATFGDCGIRVAGELIVCMPGYGDTRKATLEVLDDEGRVIRTTPLAVDARGRMTLTKAQVQEATGLKPVRQPKRRASNAGARIKPAENCPAAPAESVSPPPPIAAAPPAPIEPERQPEPAGEAMTAVLARMDALERQVRTLSRLAAPIGGKAPRSPAHERAIRRAWAERKARRERADLDARALLKVNADNRLLLEALHKAEESRDAMVMRGDTMRDERDAARAALAALGAKRRRAVVNARGALSRSRNAGLFQRQRGDVLHAQLVALKAAMADPSQPERASDLNRLMHERDQARTACSALEQRCANMQGALEATASAIEEWSSRAIRAEAMLRSAPSIAA